MKNKFNVLVLAVLMLLVGCGKEDGEVVSDKLPSYTEVEVSTRQFEFTSFNTEGLSVTDKALLEYFIEEIPGQYVVFQIDELSNVSFLTPNIPPGKYHITLEDYKIKLILIIEKIVLEKQPVEIISTFEGDLRNSWISIEGNASEDEELTSMLTSIDNYFDSASEEEKIEAAVYYQANRELINRLLTFSSDQSGKVGKFSAHGSIVGICSDEYIELCNFSKNIIAMGASVWLTYGLLATPPLELGALITGPAVAVFAKRAKRSWNEFRDKQILIIDNGIDVFYGQSKNKELKTSSSEFLSGVAKSINLKINLRPLKESDIDEDVELLRTVKEGYNTINTLIGKLNAAFSWGNENIPFFDKDLVNPLSYTTDSGVIQKSISENDFSKFDFVVDNKQINLEKNYDSNGGVLLKLTADESFVFSTSIETSIILSYEDDINEILQTFSITFVPSAIAERLELVSGDNQTAIVETLLPNPIEVIVKDQEGELLPGAIVDFTVDEGSVSLGSTITDEFGKATVSWTLGETEGVQNMLVKAFKADGITFLTGSPISISATGVVEPSLIGTWKAVSLDGVSMGFFTKYYGVSGCPSIVNQEYADDEFIVIFTETHLTLSSKYRSKEYVFEEYTGEYPRSCSSYKVTSIEEKNYNDTSVDSYELISSSLFEVSGDGEIDLLGYQLVNKDKLIINGGDGDIVLFRQ
jgi:hypothetical protein